MSPFEIAKLSIDAGLGLSLIFLAFRFFRAGISNRTVRQLQGLDLSLKTLIRDAEQAGNTLNDQLLRRQQSLEAVLRDIQGAESRAQRSLSEVQSLMAGLDNVAARTAEFEAAAPASAPQAVVQREVPPARPSARENARMLNETAEILNPKAQPEASLAARVEQVVAPQQKAAAFHESDEAAPSAKPTRVNIYGEPIEEPTTPPPPPIDRTAAIKSVLAKASAGLAKKIEKESEPEPRKAAGIDAIREAAEQLLRAGRDLESVASVTKLPLEEVRYLAHVVSREGAVAAPESARPAGDQRLGVLGRTV